MWVDTAQAPTSFIPFEIVVDYLFFNKALLILTYVVSKYVLNIAVSTDEVKITTTRSK